MASQTSSHTSTIPAETNFHTAVSDQPWSTIWHRRKLSKKKLRQIFGCSAPVDVSLGEIIKHGIPALLQSSVPLSYFLYSMLEQYSAENLFFYLEVELFQVHEFNSPEEQRKCAKYIYRAFVKSSCDMEVNLDATVKKPIRAAIDRNDQHCFDEAKEHIQKLMEPCYLNFLTSSIFQKMQDHLQGKSLPYDEHTREMALAVVVEYLDTHMPVNKELHGSSKLAEDSKRRNMLIRELTHCFARSRLHLDFYDTPEGENLAVTPQDILPPVQDSLVEKDITAVLGLK